MAKGLPRSLAHAAPGAEPSPRRVKYPVTNVTVTVTGGASTAKGLGSVVIGDLPEGNILLLGGIAYLKFTTASANAIAAFDGDYSVGTTASVDTTLDTTDADLIGLSALGPATNKVGPVARGEKAGVAVLNNTDGSLELNLNVITDDDSVTDSLTADFTVNGYVELVYIVLGDD